MKLPRDVAGKTLVAVAQHISRQSLIQTLFG